MNGINNEQNSANKKQTDKYKDQDKRRSCSTAIYRTQDFFGSSFFKKKKESDSILVIFLNKFIY